VTVEEDESRSRVALGVFKERVYQLERERAEINRELGAIDVMKLARRASNLLHSAKSLMDGNVTVLFANQPVKTSEDLYKYLEYAEGHVMKALSQEYEFEAIKQRLYMATTLAEYVLEGVQNALTVLESQME
jgi:hypothetical protein